MNKRNLAFGKRNYLICLVSVIIIIIGFIMMTGPGTSVAHGFEPSIFSTRRIVVAPMFCFFGFLLMIVAILLPNKENQDIENQEI